MPRATSVRLAVGALAGLWPAALGAQHDGPQLELQAGRWLGRNDAAMFQLRTSKHLVGPVSHGLGLLVTVSDSLGRHRAFYGAGYDLLFFRPTGGLGAYGILGTGLGLSTDTGPQRLAAHWTFGGGLDWRPFWFVGIGVEARYRVEDRGPRGFWNIGDRRKGMSWMAGAAVRWRRHRKPAQPAAPAATNGGAMASGPVTAPATITGGAGDVVRLALDAVGTPYRWGGTAANGFDCSGLVQWAYGQYGVRLPRMSRAQASAGREVPPVVDALAPGDILLFAAQPGSGVTHVGMYVGERKFIHSGTTGVRLSVLDFQDASGAYWLQRWVGARRVMP